MLSRIDLSDSLLLRMYDYALTACKVTHNVLQSSAHIMLRVICENEKLIFSIAFQSCFTFAVNQIVTMTSNPSDGSKFFCWHDRPGGDAGFLIRDPTGEGRSFYTVLNDYNELLDCNLPDNHDAPQVFECLNKGIGLFGVTANGQTIPLISKADDDCSYLNPSKYSL